MNRIRLYQSVVHQIVEFIETGGLQPGSHLPNERELARRLGVSRSTIREAEIALEAMGLIAIRPGWGVVVCCAAPVQTLTQRFEDLQILEAMSLVMGETAALAAIHANEQQLQGLANLVELIPSIDDVLLFENEVQFYRSIAQISTNSALTQAVEQLLQHYQDCAATTLLTHELKDAIIASLLDGFGAMLTGLRQRDPAQARRATRALFRAVIALRLQQLEQVAVAEVMASAQFNRQRYLALSRL